MKKYAALAVVLMFLFSGMAFAQGKGKFGHLNSNDLLAAMPEKEAATKALQDYAKQLEDQLVEMQTELEKKYNDYQAGSATMAEAVKKDKELELTNLQQRIQSFQTTAQEELQKKEAELLQPIIDKAKKAIDDVAKENGYSYVFDTGTGAMLYWPKDSDDLLPLVKTKLGIK